MTSRDHLSPGTPRAFTELSRKTSPLSDLSPGTPRTFADLPSGTSREPAYLSPGTSHTFADLPRRTARVAAPLSLVALALTILAACGPPPALPDASSPAAPLRLAAGTPVAYVLDWSWDDATRDGDAHVFTTDRGYTVTLATAYLATGRAELVPCSESPSLAGAVSSLFVRTAHAAHARVGDTSAVSAPVVEPAHAARPHLLGRAFASGHDYCSVHLLGVPVDAAAADGFALTRESLVLTGHWTAPGSPERHPLHASINLQDGSLRPLSGWTTFPTDLAPASSNVAIVLTRHPTRAFNNLDLARLGPTDLAFAVLGNLLQSTEARIATRP